MVKSATLNQSVIALRKHLFIVSFIISFLLPGVSYQIQAQLTLTSGQSATINSSVTYPSVSISGANNTLSIGSSGSMTVTGGFTWLDQPSYISIASGGALTIDGNLQGDGNTGTNNNYYPCLSTTGLTSQAMIIDCKGTLTVNGNLAAGTATKRFKNWVFLHVDSGATVTLNGNDNVLGPRGIIHVHKGGTLRVNGTNFLVEYAYSRIEIDSGGTMSAVNLTVNGNGSTIVSSACATNPPPYNGIATTTNPPYTSLIVNGSLAVSGNLHINDAAVSTSAMTSGTGHFTVGNSGTVTVGGNFMNSSTPTTTGSDTATINGTLTVTGNAINNSALNIGSTGVMTVNGSSGLLNNTGSVYGVSVIDVNGRLNVVNHLTNNGLVNINATGNTRVFGNLFNNTITTYGVAVITVINNLYVQGNLTSNDIIRAICPPGDTTAYVAWGGAWVSGAHDTVQNYSSGVKYYTGTQIPPGNALNMCTGNPATLTIVLAARPYSSLREVQTRDKLFAVQLRPSFTTQPWLTVFAYMPKRDRLSIQVTDVTGRTLVRQKVNAEKGDNTFKLDISRLSRGIYYVQVFNNNGFHKTLIAEKK
ncbi:T9SS type A sorting domain-containing protein [Niastella caeni]|uniref:T9SS type A sorting domain-containing protein n=1 Tax=Niastella caeni TaxID=2569763 RepID=A0A4S8HG12_9BACT|nr:T9SS type A sorting domain-containing protein [Niastella caeni]THU33411.1 T9SS type A sorting domain-containing protein [Niastella caeni]